MPFPHLRFAAGALLLVCLHARATTVEPHRSLDAVALLSLQKPTSPRLSPDGHQVLYDLARPDWRLDRMAVDLWRIDADGGNRRRLVSGGGRQASWSPDGRRIAFVGKRQGDKVAQIYLLPNDGGEAVRLTRHGSGVDAIRWSADGRQLYFLADRTSPRPDAQERARNAIAAFEKPRRRRALWRADSDSGKIEAVVQGDFDVGSFDVDSHGQVVYQLRRSRLLDDGPSTELWLLRPGVAARQLTRNDFAERAPLLSPDGRHVLFLANAEHGRYATVNANLFVLDLATLKVDELQHGLPWNIEQAQWGGDERIIFSATTGVRREMFSVEVASDRLSPLARGDFSIGGFDNGKSGDLVVYAASSATSPGDLHIGDGLRPRWRALTRYSESIAGRKLPRQVAIQWQGADGQALEGLLTYPLDYVEGRRYPLIVQSHGGPRSSDVFNVFAYGRFNTVLAEHGFATLSVNYRGGVGYGDDFLQGMNGGYFRHADKDVLSGVDLLVARGIADPERLGLMGWSAGGHMTNRLITVTDRFKAAASGAGAVDWPSMYLTSDTRWQRQEWFLTPPYGSQARRDLYTEYSPLSQLDKVRTPTLILAGDRDERVPWSQSVMLYRALKALGVETQLYLAPGEPHNFRKLSHRLFQINAQMDWFMKHVGNDNYVWEVPPQAATAAAGDTASR